MYDSYYCLFRDRTLLKLAVLGFLICSGTAYADRPRTYAVTDVRIVTAPGEVIEIGTVVIRDGLIEAVGANVSVPGDAEIIEGEDSWTIYPAFIDAASAVGLETEEGGPPGGRGRGEQKTLGAPHELKAVRPENMVLEELDLAHASIEKHRDIGFAVAQVMPREGVFRGQSVIILLRAGAPNELILRDQAAQVVSLEYSSFMAPNPTYPSSKIGAMATVRQGFLDAKRIAEWQARYAANPVGLQRPEYRSSDAALIEVLEKRTPLIFLSQRSLDPGRFDKLATEFELDAVMVARNAGDRADRLQDSGMPILLPLEIPEKPELGDDDEIVETTMEDMQSWLFAPRLPAALADSGVEFAFVTFGMKSVRKFSENLAAAVEAGLDPDQALGALTTVPAELLGLSEVMGTLEPGKQANMLIVEGELFVEKPNLRHVFVDGHHEEIEAKETIGDPDAVVDPRGTWEIITEVMGRSSESTWTISGNEDAYDGFVESESAGKNDFDNIDLVGNAMTVLYSTPNGEMEITVVVTEQALSGTTTLESPRGSVTIKVSGDRISGPEGEE